MLGHVGVVVLDAPEEGDLSLGTIYVRVEPPSEDIHTRVSVSVSLLLTSGGLREPIAIEAVSLYDAENLANRILEAVRIARGAEPSSDSPPGVGP